MQRSVVLVWMCAHFYIMPQNAVPARWRWAGILCSLSFKWCKYLADLCNGGGSGLVTLFKGCFRTLWGGEDYYFVVNEYRTFWDLPYETVDTLRSLVFVINFTEVEEAAMHVLQSLVFCILSLFCPQQPCTNIKTFTHGYDSGETAATSWLNWHHLVCHDFYWSAKLLLGLKSCSVFGNFYVLLQ